MSKARVASLMSLVVPGLGQIYNGDFWRGMLFLLFSAGLWVGAGGVALWVCDIATAPEAHISSACLSASEMLAWFGPIAAGHLPACFCAYRRGLQRDAESQRPAPQS